MLARLSVITPPQTLPVGTYLVRHHGRIDNGDDDDLISLYIGSAVNLVESFLNRALITQTLAWSFADTFPPNAWPLVPVNPVVFVLPLAVEWAFSHYMQRDIDLPRPTVQAVNSVSYETWHDAPTETTLTAGTDYHVDLTCDPGRVRLNTDCPWTNRASLTINYTTGYGDTASSIPPAIIHAILLTVTNLYQNRGDTDRTGLPPAAELLLWPYRMVMFS